MCTYNTWLTWPKSTCVKPLLTPCRCHTKDPPGFIISATNNPLWDSGILAPRWVQTPTGYQVTKLGSGPGDLPAVGWSNQGLIFWPAKIPPGDMIFWALKWCAWHDGKDLPSSPWLPAKEDYPTTVDCLWTFPVSDCFRTSGGQAAFSFVMVLDNVNASSVKHWPQLNMGLSSGNGNHQPPLNFGYIWWIYCV